MLLDEMSARLTTAGLTVGYTVIKGTLPATPDAVMALYETGGAGPSIPFSGAVVESPTLKIVARGAPNDYATPRRALERIYQATMGWGAFTAGGVRYLSVTPLQPPFPQHRDANERVEMTVNFLVEKEPSPAP